MIVMSMSMQEKQLLERKMMAFCSLLHPCKSERRQWRCIFPWLLGVAKQANLSRWRRIFHWYADAQPNKFENSGKANDVPRPPIIIVVSCTPQKWCTLMEFIDLGENCPCCSVADSESLLINDEFVILTSCHAFFVSVYYPVNLSIINKTATSSSNHNNVDRTRTLQITKLIQQTTNEIIKQKCREKTHSRGCRAGLIHCDVSYL